MHELLGTVEWTAIDVIWHTPVSTGIEHTVRRRATAFGVILLIAVLLIAFVAVHSALGTLDALLPFDQTVIGAVTRTLGWALSLLLGATMVSVMLRVLPRTAVSCGAALIGGIVTTAALAVDSGLFGLYLGTVGSARRRAPRPACSSCCCGSTP